MAELFDTKPQNIIQHLNNIYLECEINQKTNCKDFLQVQQEGDREIKRNKIGMTSWRKSPKGKIIPSDVTITKKLLKKAKK